MTDTQRKYILELLWDYMRKGRTEKEKDRVITGWGNKTQDELVACIDRIMTDRLRP